MKSHVIVNAFAAVLFTTVAFASHAQSGFDEQLLQLQHKWAKVNYTLQDDAQLQAFEALSASAKALVTSFPQRAEPLVWYGIIESSFAGAKGGIGALSNAREAKNALEQALKTDDTVLDGSAYTSLGILYHKVPGWPVSFGDDDDARRLLEKAISLNPTGIDPNYFYAEFLYDEREYTKAKTHLMQALSAPPRATRPLADESRRAEVQALLSKVEKKLTKKKKKN